MNIGARIRKQREGLGLSLRNAAQQAGISPSLVSQIETGKVDPSLNTLRKLALVLGTPLFALVLEEGPPNRVIVRADERREVVFPEAGLSYQILHSHPQKKMGVHLGLLKPQGGTSRELLGHEGEECVVVIEGRLEVISHEGTSSLEPRDSIYFDSSVPHRLFNPGPKDCRFWLIISPPKF